MTEKLLVRGSMVDPMQMQVRAGASTRLVTQEPPAGFEINWPDSLGSAVYVGVAPAYEYLPAAQADSGPFSPTPQGGVECDERKMEIGRPYPFQVSGIWFVAVRHGEEEGSSAVCEIPDGT